MFLSAEANAETALPTINRRLAGIGWMHLRIGLQLSQVCVCAAELLEGIAGIRRSHGGAPVRKQVADAAVLRAIVGDL